MNYHSFVRPPKRLLNNLISHMAYVIGTLLLELTGARRCLGNWLQHELPDVEKHLYLHMALGNLTDSGIWARISAPKLNALIHSFRTYIILIKIIMITVQHISFKIKAGQVNHFVHVITNDKTLSMVIQWQIHKSFGAKQLQLIFTDDLLYML